MPDMGLTEEYESWGRVPKARHRVAQIDWRAEEPEELFRSMDAEEKILPYGQGRSYGDSCLNDCGLLLVTQGLDRYIEFDPHTGILRCEAGATLEEILKLVVPCGWFLPVTPGTKYVSIGGAIANDVHGKNHHRAGTFGRFVTRLELLRSDGLRRICSPEENTDLYRATIGGLGLTGLILWAEIQLRTIHNPYIQMESVRMKNLEEFFEISSDSDEDYEFTVSWIDCMARGESLGRGIFMRGNFAAPQLDRVPPAHRERKVPLPFDAPNFLLNGAGIRAFNWLYYHWQFHKREERLMHYEPFFYPLDSLQSWNRLYGRRGFFQYQCVVPYKESQLPMKKILELIARSGTGSFLAVLKAFGDLPSPGMLSFPQPGVTLALDFPNSGSGVLRLFEHLDELVRESGGRVYPAKDARMSPRNFKAYYPNWREFATYIDPRFSSSFWRRVTETE